MNSFWAIHSASEFLDFPCPTFHGSLDSISSKVFGFPVEDLRGGLPEPSGEPPLGCLGHGRWSARLWGHPFRLKGHRPENHKISGFENAPGCFGAFVFVHRESRSLGPLCRFRVPKASLCFWLVDSLVALKAVGLDPEGSFWWKSLGFYSPS